MEGLSFRTSINVDKSDIGLLSSSILHPILFVRLSVRPKFRRMVISASKDEHRFTEWDQMELKFGKMLGEDPKLTLAKIIGKKLNPDMSNLEIEKLFYKKKGKGLSYDIEEAPLDERRESTSSNSLDGLNLVQPIPKKGIKFVAYDKPKESGIKRPTLPVTKAVANARSHVPDVILRKPSVFSGDDAGTRGTSSLKIQPNLSLNMGKENAKGRFSDMMLVRKPKPITIKHNQEQEPVGDTNEDFTNTTGKNDVNRESASNNVSLVENPEMLEISGGIEIREDYVGSSYLKDVTEDDMETATFSESINLSKIDHGKSLESWGSAAVVSGYKKQIDSVTELQPFQHSDGSPVKHSASIEASERKLANSSTSFSTEAAIHKPTRVDQSLRGNLHVPGDEIVATNSRSYNSAAELENPLTTSPFNECEDMDWTRAEDLIQTGEREEVELISSSTTRGFVVSFGSLIGFLPYRNLAAKYKYLAFESWLRRKGLDPTMYRDNLSIIGSYESTSKIATPNSSRDLQGDGKTSADMELEELLMIYDQEKLKFLSSFVGQKFKVNVIMADRKSRRLIFSVKPKEKEESVEKKKKLMAKLNIGDVVRCQIKKITYFGIFVEVEGVPALIHQTEVSWDATLEPASYFKIGQIVEAKVHQLDFSLERIFLSLKDVVPDPLNEALEAVVGDHDFLGEKIASAEADTEWTDVENLIEELQRFEGIQYVSRGRFFLSPGLAPTFQVYMASMFEDQYKLLARAGNRVQEVIVEASLGKEEMKSAILTCTNRVV